MLFDKLVADVYAAAVGIQFDNIELNYLYDHIMADTLHLNYADCVAQFYYDDYLVQELPIKIVVN